MMQLLGIVLSPKKDKRFTALFEKKSDKIKQIHFGSKNGKTFIDHQDKTKKRNWLKRHSKNIIRFQNNPYTPMTLSRMILWNKPTIDESLENFIANFDL